MKNSFKMIPVLAGMSLAVLGSFNEAKASENEAAVNNGAAFYGNCVGDGICGTTSQGTTLIGKWHED